MAVETTVADSSETVVASMNRSDPVEGSSSSTNNSCASEQASPDSSCVIMDEQVQTAHDPQQQQQQQQAESVCSAMDTTTTTTPPQSRQNSVIRLIRPELLMKEEHVSGATDFTSSPPRIDVIVNPHQFQPEFRPMMQYIQQRRSIKRPSTANVNNASAVVSSSTSPGPSSRTPPPPQHLLVQQQQQRPNNSVVMGPPPPPALLLLPPPPMAILPKNSGQNSNKSTPANGQQRIRKSTAGAHRRYLATPLDHEEPSSSIPEIGKSHLKIIHIMWEGKSNFVPTYCLRSTNNRGSFFL